MVNFMVLYGLKLILSAIFIVGFYLITRGEWVNNPDGTKEWKGKIFSFWSKFLQRHKVRRAFYTGDGWPIKMAELMEFFNDADIIEVLDTGVLVNKMSEKRAGLFKVFCAKNNILYTVRSYGSGSLISVYKEEKEFALPFFITAPLGECITCLSSVWGSAMFIFWWRISEYTDSVYYNFISNLPVLFFICLWITFCISLAFLNEILFYLNYRLKK